MVKTICRGLCGWSRVSFLRRLSFYTRCTLANLKELRRNWNVKTVARQGKSHIWKLKFRNVTKSMPCRWLLFRSRKAFKVLRCCLSRGVNSTVVWKYRGSWEGSKLKSSTLLVPQTETKMNSSFNLPTVQLSKVPFLSSPFATSFDMDITMNTSASK